MLRHRADVIWRSPAWIVLIAGLILLLILVVRGLNIGPLHTDVIIIRSWFKQVGLSGFANLYFEKNQRHVLVGPIYTVAYALFGENDLPYNLIFQLGRVFEGVFMAGLVYQITRRRAFAVCVGLALLTTVFRVRELYQGINWFIEPTLALLLASSYFYVLSLRGDWGSRSGRMALYFLSFLCYLVSILIYESGIPWILVNLFLGWIMRPGIPVVRRGWYVVRDALPSLICGAVLAFAVIYVFIPWQGLAPDPSAGAPSRVLQEMATLFSLPGTILAALQVTLHDGYGGMIALFAVIAGLVALILMIYPRFPSPSLPAERGPGGEVNPQPFPTIMLVALSVVMVLAGILIGTANQLGEEYLDRITFDREAGIMLLWVTLIFGVFSLLRGRWRTVLAVAITALVLIGPGFAWMWIYQDYAHGMHADIDRMTAALLDVRRLVYAPVHFVILTDPDWVGARMNDASDVLVHEIQQKVWDAGGNASLDILKAGTYPGDYAVFPGTCDTVDHTGSAGMCLTPTEVYSSRFAFAGTHPNDDIVIVHYDQRAATMTIIPSVQIQDLPDYNIVTSGPTRLCTNAKRLAVPLADACN